jgi:hypothetical protein
MLMENLTPPSPPLSGGEQDTPSPDKGRAGEGLGFLKYDKRLTALARENRKNPTPAETLIWQKLLRSKQLEHYKFHRQKPIGPTSSISTAPNSAWSSKSTATAMPSKSTTTPSAPPSWKVAVCA